MRCGLITTRFHHARLLAKGRPHAFTLIELMVVVVLIGILTAMILPEMRGTYSDALLRTSSRDLVNVCGIAYSRAVSFRQIHRVSLDPRLGRFLLEKRLGPAEGDGEYAPVKDVPGGEGEIDHRITVQILRPDNASSVESAPQEPDDAGAETQGIRFYPDGTADSADILLQDPEGFGLRLRINSITSRVRIVPSSRQ